MAEEKKVEDVPAHMVKFGKVVQEETFRGQAIFFLNAFWAELGEKECETIWNTRLIFREVADEGNQGDHELDDFQSARVFEKEKLTMTVLERRKALREIDIDSNNKMGTLEYLVWKYKVDVPTLMKRPQGTNEELKKAEKALKAVMEQIATIESRKAYLENLVATTSGGVKLLKAKNELSQLLDQDNLPLNRAII